jgi:hypothetical protein
MSFKPGYSDDIISENTRMLMRRGRNKRQATILAKEHAEQYRVEATKKKTRKKTTYKSGDKDK